jgi:site-specific recombinase XerD
MAKQNFIYFSQAGENGPIKIGRSVDVDRRAADIQVSSAEKLRVLATISSDPALERELHQRFAAFRLNGEWFSPAEPLIAFIDSLPKQGAASISSVRAKLFARRNFGGIATVDEVLAAKLQTLSSVLSRRAYANDWQQFCAWLVVQEIEVLKATPRIVRGYIAHQHEVGLARPTISRSLSVIREIYGAFVADELLDINPAREIKNPRVSHEPKTPWLHEEDMKKLLDVPAQTWQERRDRLCVRLLFGLGWRRAEVARMRVENFRDGTVTGIVKGNKTLTVGVPEWLQAAIDDWLTFSGITEGALLPRSPSKRAAVSGEIVYKIVRSVATRAGVKVSPHGLRRTNITLGGQRGTSLKERQLSVGHTSQATTERYDRARDAAENAPGQVFKDMMEKK